MKILFVCTGNTCRSPMAEALAAKALHDAGAKAEVFSRGVIVYYAAPASQHAITVMRDCYGLDISGHISRSVLDEDVISADVILAMTEAHKSLLLTFYEPLGIRCKTYTLAEYAKNAKYADTNAAGISGAEGCILDISDPYGGDINDYKACAVQINKLIAICLKKLLAIEG